MLTSAICLIASVSIPCRHAFIVFACDTAAFGVERLMHGSVRLGDDAPGANDGIVAIGSQSQLAERALRETILRRRPLRRFRSVAQVSFLPPVGRWPGSSATVAGLHHAGYLRSKDPCTANLIAQP